MADFTIVSSTFEEHVARSQVVFDYYRKFIQGFAAIARPQGFTGLEPRASRSP